MRWLAAVVLVGCWGNSSTPPIAPQPLTEPSGTWRPSRPPDRCITTVPKIYGNLRADPTSSRFPAAMLDELEAASMDLCHVEAWSDEVFDCHDKAGTLNATMTCYRTVMTDDERDAFELKFNEIANRYQLGYTPPVTP